MSDEKVDSQVEKSLFEFQQYLSDQLAPLIVSDSMELLMKGPPELIAATINSWVSGQQGVTRSIRVSDFYFHAVKKIHLMGEYNLVGQQELTEFLAKLKPLVVQYCPPAERELLRQNLDRMADVPATISSPVEVLYRQGGGSVETGSSESSIEVTKDSDVHRLGLLMQKIEKDLSAIAASGESGTQERQQEVVSEALAQAALSPRDDGT